MIYEMLAFIGVGISSFLAGFIIGFCLGVYSSSESKKEKE